MSTSAAKCDVVNDDLRSLEDKGPASVTFGETMVRDAPAEMQRRECTRQVNVSMAGSEHTPAIFLARLGIPSAVTIRYPDSFEQHFWEAAVADDKGSFCRAI